MKCAVIIPTIREEQMKGFLEAWKPFFEEAAVSVYVVEDNPEKQFKLDPGLTSGRFQHLCWSDIPSPVLACVSTKSSASRLLGVWKAWEDGADIFITLDDDVRPSGKQNIFEEFVSILTGGLPLWVNPLSNYRSRGYPAENAGKIMPSFHAGSFLGIPDVYGETQLKYEKRIVSDPPRYVDRPVIVPESQLLVVNGGICGWVRELAPFVHYGLEDDAYGYKRHEDIWMGIILKRCLDLAGKHMSYGPPFVQHIRASDARINAQKEVKAMAYNEELWEAIDSRLPEARKAITMQEASDVLARILREIDNPWTQAEAKAMVQWRSILLSTPVSSAK